MLYHRSSEPEQEAMMHEQQGVTAASGRGVFAAVALIGTVVAGATLIATGDALWAAPSSRALTGPGLTAFASDAELRAYLRTLRRQQRRREELAPPPVAYAPEPAPTSSAADTASSVVVTGSRVDSPSITNTQEANVDEGGIVKVYGDYLVILRRGRLFTVSVGDNMMRPVDAIDAYPPGVSGQGDWYDEMLVSGDRVIVIGYSYARGGTEVNRFRIGADGKLRFEDAYNLRSNDYYSSRNYASRLIGNRLIFYTPLYLNWNRDPFEALPGIRRWRQGERDTRAFKPIANARQVYIPPAMRDSPDVSIDTLHSVTTCDLTAAELDCSAIAVLGPSSRTFYVSGNAVYLWMSDTGDGRSGRRGAAHSLIYRMPFARERPSAIAARGAPVDQFSFREDADKTLNVLLRDEGGGDWMFRPEVSAGKVALLRLPLSDFGDGSREARQARYRSLPSPSRVDYTFQNRFVGDYILYGAGVFGDDSGRRASVTAVPVRGGPVATLPVGHAVERIEVMGRDAMIVGGMRGALGFTAIELGQVGGGGGPRLGSTYLHPASSQGESRSHAYFFKPDATTPDGASGIVGLPVTRPAEAAYRRFFGSAAAMVFLRRENRQLALAGELAAQQKGVVDDGCKASCVDWYGNARPIFLRNRTFALMGYELVEGDVSGGRVREVARISFSPPSRRQ